MAEHASQLYARNIQSLLGLMISEEGALELDFEDEVIAGACITRGGEIVHEGAKGRGRRGLARRPSMDRLVIDIAVLVLAGFVGFAVISKVPNTLHTPLMSGTNAIHGIVVLGGLLLMAESSGVLEKVLLVIAVAFGTINVIGGFLVTDRMLEMFKAKDPPKAEETDAEEDRIVSSRRRSSCRTRTSSTRRYIVAFALMIYGMSGLTGPRTAVRGNQIAAVGMAIAVVATLLRKGEFHGSGTVWLIVARARDRHGGRRPGGAQRAHDRDAADGGAVQRRRRRRGGADRLGRVPPPLRRRLAAALGDLRAVRGDRRLDLVLGLEHRLRQAPGDPPGPADQAARARAFINLGLFVVAVASAVVLAAGTHSQALFILGILVAAAVLGNMVVLPIGGADMPVVISLLNAFTGLSAAATGVALSNPLMIVAGMIVGASGTILTNLMAKAMNRSVPAIVAGGFGGDGRRAGRRRRRDGRHGALDQRRRTSRSSSPTRARS